MAASTNSPRYRGKRYRFEYPAYPNLNDQQGMWKLLYLEDIGVRLTEEMMRERSGRAGFGGVGLIQSWGRYKWSI